MTGRHKILPVLLSLIVCAAASGQPSNPSLQEQLWLNAPAIEESEFEMLLTIARLRQDLLVDEDSLLFSEIIHANPEAFGLTQSQLRELRENPFALLDSKPALIRQIVERAEEASLNYRITRHESPGRSALGDYDFRETEFVKSEGRVPYFELDAVWRRRTRTLPFESFISPAPVEISKIDMSRDKARDLMNWLGSADSDYTSRLTTHWEYQIERVEPGTRPGKWIAHIRPRELSISAQRRPRRGLQKAWENMAPEPFLTHVFTPGNVESDARVIRSDTAPRADGIIQTKGSNAAAVTGDNDANEAVANLFRMLRPLNEVITADDASRAAIDYLLRPEATYDKDILVDPITQGSISMRNLRAEGLDESIFRNAVVLQATDDQETQNTITLYTDPLNPERVFHFMLRMEHSSRVTPAEKDALLDALTDEWGEHYIDSSDTWIWSADPAAVLGAQAGLEDSGVHCLEDITLTLPRSRQWDSPENPISAPILRARRGPGDELIQHRCPPLIHVRVSKREILIQRYDAEVAVDANIRLDEYYRRQTEVPETNRIEELFNRE